MGSDSNSSLKMEQVTINNVTDPTTQYKPLCELGLDKDFGRIPDISMKRKPELSVRLWIPDI